MADVPSTFANVAQNPEFFVKFAPQRLGVRLVRIALASRKLPMVGQVTARRPQRDQKSILALDYGRHHNDALHGAMIDERRRASPDEASVVTDGPVIDVERARLAR